MIPKNKQKVNKSGDTMTGNLLIDKNTGDTYYIAKRSDKEVEVKFGIGTGGINHGVWSKPLNKWLLYTDGANVFLGNKSKTFQINDAATKGVKSATSKTHTGYGTNNGYLVDVSMLSFWNGAHSSANTSNLTYCSDGTIQAKPTSLFNSSSGTTEKVTLSQSASNFSYLEIFYKNSAGDEQSLRIASPNGKKVALTSLYYEDSFFAFYREVTISGTSITNNNYGQVWFSNNGTANISKENKISIMKVLGYK